MNKSVNEELIRLLKTSRVYTITSPDTRALAI